MLSTPSVHVYTVAAGRRHVRSQMKAVAVQRRPPRTRIIAVCTTVLTAVVIDTIRAGPLTSVDRSV